MRAVSIAVACEIVTAIGECGGVPGIRAMPHKDVFDVQVGGTSGGAAAKRHRA